MITLHFDKSDGNQPDFMQTNDAVTAYIVLNEIINTVVKAIEEKENESNNLIIPESDPEDSTDNDTSMSSDILCNDQEKVSTIITNDTNSHINSVLTECLTDCDPTANNDHTYCSQPETSEGTPSPKTSKRQQRPNKRKGKPKERLTQKKRKCQKNCDRPKYQCLVCDYISTNQHMHRHILSKHPNEHRYVKSNKRPNLFKKLPKN